MKSCSFNWAFLNRVGKAICLTVVFAGFKGVAEDFAVDILPILTKAGCNSGECHGSAIGQGGFKLSLLGYDPNKDYHTITRDLFARRINLEYPEKSLFLQKPTRAVSHKGGRLFQTSDKDYQTLLKWVGHGVPLGESSLKVIGLQIKPEEIFPNHPGDAGSVSVIARFSDGSNRDVTAHALMHVLDDTVASVDDQGRIQVHARGLTSVMVRYSGQVASLRVGARFNPKYLDSQVDSSHPIDEILFSELNKLGLPASPKASPEVLLRRVYLDLTGQLPPMEMVRDYLNSRNDPGFLNQVIDNLLGSEGFVDLWTYRFADLLLVSPKKQGAQPYQTYHDWIRQQIESNAPIDRVVRSLLTGLGDVAVSGPANFYRLTSDPRDMGEFVSQTFLGMRLACARCHHHPFDRWGMDDYYSFASWFAETSLEGNRVVLKDRGEIEHPETRKVMQPAFPGSSDKPPLNDYSKDRRHALADWVVAPSNPHFAKTFVNRIWKHILGRGLVEPVDDLRPTNPASHPRLLQFLAADFADQGFDFRRLVRLLVTSQAYQLSSQAIEGNQEDERFFSRAYAKPLTGAVFVDALSQSTGIPWSFEGAPVGSRALELTNPEVESYSLDVLGRCPRTDSCTNPELFGGGLPQSLHLMNDHFLNQSIRDGIVRDWLEAGHTDQQMVEDLYLRLLCRYPEAVEMDHWLSEAVHAEDRETFFRDLLWAMLNSREFSVVN